MPVGDQLLDAVETFEHERGRIKSRESPRASVALVATRSARADCAALEGRTHIRGML